MSISWDRIKIWHDWQFHHVNWIEFTLIKIYFERVHIYGASELEIALLGFHLSISWVHDRVTCDQFTERMHKDIEETVSAPAANPESPRDRV
jgi:hypothetical protein